MNGDRKYKAEGLNIKPATPTRENAYTFFFLFDLQYTSPMKGSRRSVSDLYAMKETYFTIALLHVMIN
jgi:hypothetical protein